MAFVSTFNCSNQFSSIAMAALSPADKSARSTVTNQQQYGGYEEKVRNVRQGLVKLAPGNTSKELIVIDHIQRLGIEHLFADEIREAMERQHIEFYSGDQNHEQDELHEVALRFRLLRQQGYHVPSDMFKKFRNRNGEFEGLSNNIEGLMALFEASQMSIPGENILVEANVFTTHLLQHLDRNKPPHANKYVAAIDTALKVPYHKSLGKLTAMELLQSTDQMSEGWLLELRELAKLDFDMAATSYKNEFLHFSRWWKEVGLAEELVLVRNEPVKWYSWAVACLSDPNMWEERLNVAKPTALVYVVDDLFDVYGDIHHLSLFTQAIESWSLAALEELPEYMRSTWRAIFDATNDISYKIEMKSGYNPETYLHKAWADFCNACLIEAKWNTSGYLPTTSEYLKIGIVTSGVPMILCHVFFNVVETLNTQTVQLLNDDPRIISSVATILRLSDDLGSAKDEGQSGFDGSYVNCYMKEKEGVSMDATRETVHEMIAEAWKELNKECLHLQPHPFSSTHSFGRGCLNSARMVPLMYGYEDGRLPGLDKFLTLLLNENA